MTDKRARRKSGGEPRPKRLVVALTRDEHRRMKLDAIEQDMTVMDMVRQMLFKARQ